MDSRNDLSTSVLYEGFDGRSELHGWLLLHEQMSSEVE